MDKDILDLDFAKKINPDRFYNSYQVWLLCKINYPINLLKGKRDNWYLEEWEYLMVNRGKRSSYFYKGSALLRLFYGIDINNPKHLELLK